MNTEVVMPPFAKVVPVALIAATAKYTKKNIPKALREQVWLKHVGPRYYGKCKTPWCSNRMNVFNFHVSHVIAEANGGSTTLENLLPLCDRCNLSMGTTPFSDWCHMGKDHDEKNKWLKYMCICC
jgi:5-methylcytosine-specific restriction endonuclease McrA